MASYFQLTLDTLAPTISAFSINSGASVTTSTTVTLAITSSDASSMKIWGINGIASEADASWETFASTKSVTLTSGDGSKTVYVKVRDSVYNESSASSATITLSTALPTISVVGADVSVISEQSGKNVATFSFTSNMALKAWKVKVVPANNSAQDAGAG